VPEQQLAGAIWTTHNDKHQTFMTLLFPQTCWLNNNK